MGSRRSQVTTVGWLGAQGVGEIVERFAATAQTLNRRRGLNGAAAPALGKQRKRAAKNGDDADLIARPGSKKKPRRAFTAPARSQGWPRRRPERIRSSPAMRCLPRALFIIFTKLPLGLKSKLLPNLCNNSKISKNKSCSKSKVLQLCFYNHPLIWSTF